MIKAEVEYNELSDGSKVYDLVIYNEDTLNKVFIPCYSQEAAWRFEEEFKDLLDRYAI